MEAPGPGILPLVALVLELEAAEPVRFPAFAGPYLRSGLGRELRQAVCSTGAPRCEGCLLLSSCLYPRVFETPVDRDSASVLRKYSDAPRPFTLAPRPTPAPLAPGERLEVDLTLIGPARETLPHFLLAFERMGARCPAGRFRLLGGRLAGPAGGVVYDGVARTLAGRVPVAAPPPPAPAFELMLELLTPLRLRVGESYAEQPTLVEITQALVRRLRLLRAIYGDGRHDPDWAKPLLQAADGAQTRHAWFEPAPGERYSRKQGRHVPTSGVLGSIEVTGDLTLLAAWLRFAEPLHVGSGATMGLGRFRTWAR